MPVLCDVEVQPDANGVLIADTNQKLTYIRGYSDINANPADLVVPVKQLEDVDIAIYGTYQGTEYCVASAHFDTIKTSNSKKYARKTVKLTFTPDQTYHMGWTLMDMTDWYCDRNIGSWTLK